MSDCFTPDETAAAAQWKGGWAHLRSSLVVVLMALTGSVLMEKNKNHT